MSWRFGDPNGSGDDRIIFYPASQCLFDAAQSGTPYVVFYHVFFYFW
jgi:hypothetical protein